MMNIFQVRDANKTLWSSFIRRMSGMDQ